MSKKKWVKLSENVTVELSGIRSVTCGESTYLYVKYVGERQPTGYPMKTKQAQMAAHDKLTAELLKFNKEFSK